MTAEKRVALISVYDKTGVAELARELVNAGWEIISTGGTFRVLEKAGIEVKRLSQYTGFGEILDGRVKSLHPRVHGGLLALRSKPEHLAQLKKEGIKPIDLVAVNLYPFREKALSGELEFSRVLEFIDIGGVALLRAAAKNFGDVLVLSDPQDYGRVLKEMKKEKGKVSSPTRRELAAKAFYLTSIYDAAVSRFLVEETKRTFPSLLELSSPLKFELRYGENPHQKAAFYGAAAGGCGVTQARQLQGKQLSYNNLLDLESALSLVLMLEKKAAVVVKHTNPCGAAESASLLQSYRRARETDPVSAFGSIVAFNSRVDKKTAEEVTSTFVEALIAPAYTPAARVNLSRKKNLRVLETGPFRKRPPSWAIRSIYGGLLVQEEDGLIWRKDELQTVTKKRLSLRDWSSLAFAWKVCAQTKSNAIVLARERSTVGIGAGQMSRIDAARLALTKAGEAGIKVSGSVLASDAFFPFRDVVDLAAAAGVEAIIQPGGSIRDQESIAAADEHGLAMVFTGLRHFKH